MAQVNLKPIFCNNDIFLNVNNDSILNKNVGILSGYYQNVRGIKSKLSNIFLNYISLNHYDYFILTETWLTTDINNN